jgi:hypothetical protein
MRHMHATEAGFGFGHHRPLPALPTRPSRQATDVIGLNEKRSPRPSQPQHFLTFRPGSASLAGLLPLGKALYSPTACFDNSILSYILWDRL